jgi:protein-disulfide isomerase
MTNLNHRRTYSVTAGYVSLLLIVSTLYAQDGKTVPPKIVGMFQSNQITEEALNNAAAHDLANLEMQRLAAEAGFVRMKRRILENTLDQILEEKILAAEAAKQGITKEALYAREVTGKAKSPTQSEVQSYYVANKLRFPQPLDPKLMKQIEEHLRAENINKAMTDLLEPLKRHYGAVSMLEPLRVDIKTDGSPSRGPNKAPVNLVVFSDFECQDCATLADRLREVEAKYGNKVRIAFKNFPILKLHPAAEKAAEAALCAADQQRFWEMHDLMYQDTGRLSDADLQARASRLQLDLNSFNSCLGSSRYAAKVRDDMLDGARAGVTTTPALFINGLVVPGTESSAIISAVIDKEIAARMRTSSAGAIANPPAPRPSAAAKK